MKMEQKECTETSAHQIQTPGDYPKERIQHSEHGESLKSRKLMLFLLVAALFACSQKKFCNFLKTFLKTYFMKYNLCVEQSKNGAILSNFRYACD
jgi:hypothetical protein